MSAPASSGTAIVSVSPPMPHKYSAVRPPHGLRSFTGAPASSIKKRTKRALMEYAVVISG
jgi:hypothetical protein